MARQHFSRDISYFTAWIKIKTFCHSLKLFLIITTHYVFFFIKKDVLFQVKEKMVKKIMNLISKTYIQNSDNYFFITKF